MTRAVRTCRAVVASLLLIAATFALPACGGDDGADRIKELQEENRVLQERVQDLEKKNSALTRSSAHTIGDATPPGEGGWMAPVLAPELAAERDEPIATPSPAASAPK
jgi:hypothetical protein